jgi:glucosamine kinase
VADKNVLLLGVDGGGTRCRARLSTLSGQTLSDAVTGPANLRLGLDVSFAAVSDAALQCLDRADLPKTSLEQVVACLALAGASEPGDLAAAQKWRHPFRKALIVTDAEAACIGAHGEGDGGVIIAGTGTVGWARVNSEIHRIGGWGLPISDEGSGAWLGIEALRRVVWASDGRMPWTPLLRALFADFADDPHAIVKWTAKATPRDFGSLAPRIADYAARRDAVGVELMQIAAAHIDDIAARLVALGAVRLALVGGLTSPLRSWLATATALQLVEPLGDALDGALQLGRSAAVAQARVA